MELGSREGERVASLVPRELLAGTLSKPYLPPLPLHADSLGYIIHYSFTQFTSSKPMFVIRHSVGLLLICELGIIQLL